MSLLPRNPPLGGRGVTPDLRFPAGPPPGPRAQPLILAPPEIPGANATGNSGWFSPLLSFWPTLLLSRMFGTGSRGTTRQGYFTDHRLKTYVLSF